MFIHCDVEIKVHCQVLTFRVLDPANSPMAALCAFRLAAYALFDVIRNFVVELLRHSNVWISGLKHHLHVVVRFDDWLSIIRELCQSLVPGMVSIEPCDVAG